MVDTVSIGGIKLSSGFVQIDFRESDAPEINLLALLKKITSAKVSIPHLHLGKAGPGMQTTICIEEEEFPRLQVEIEEELQKGVVRLLPATGTLSIFPHRYDLGLCNRVIQILQKASLPIHGVSTSVSALVVHTDYDALDDAADQVLKVCELPPNHTPLRPVVVLGDEVVETIAVYWEPKVRIYGMSMEEDFLMFGTTEEVEGLDAQTFKLLNGISVDDRIYQNIVVSKKKVSADLDSFPHQYEEVDLVSFHGPHFQDRYGIADLAFSLLLKRGYSLLSCSCTGTSVQLIVKKGVGRDVVECLQEGFIVPSSSDK